ncbi:hypothetical protein CEXT_677661 [Caerostris extrusa]|uniref:Uncharacterized protein n=1 Tax=Caerostris extrusa TaxID=172846 RepID=A0AAV4X894_CAEEX|nr:hypothetical protein CEXT_677661 [Caerostris extrusa]
MTPLKLSPQVLFLQALHLYSRLPLTQFRTPFQLKHNLCQLHTLEQESGIVADVSNHYFDWSSILRISDSCFYCQLVSRDNRRFVFKHDHYSHIIVFEI